MRDLAGGEFIVAQRNAVLVGGAATDNFGRIDVVSNNAGDQRNGKFSDLTEQLAKASKLWSA